MTKLVICRGLPASGKTTWARRWVAEDPASRARVNRDDLRAMLHDGVWLGPETEGQIVKARDRLIGRLLGAGVNVVSDDTNLSQPVCRQLMRLGRQHAADIEIVNLTDVPFEECVRRDAARESPVGVEVIQRMHKQFLKGRPLPLPDPVEVDETAEPLDLYVPDPALAKAWLVDVDGTLALMDGRSPFEWHRVGEDKLNKAVYRAVDALSEIYMIVVISGRDEVCRDQTVQWLREHAVSFDLLLMRPEGDTRKDAVVKHELFTRHVAPRFNIVGVLDDRDQVVAMWREIGLPCFQVAPGAF